MKNIYEVFNDVNAIRVDEMDIQDEEVKTIMNRLDIKKKKRTPLISAAACVAGMCLLSGGMVYAYTNNVFSKMIEKQNNGTIAEKYLDDELLNNEYEGGYQILGLDESDDISIDVLRYEVNSNKVYLSVLMTYEAFDAEKYGNYSVEILPVDGDDIALFDGMGDYLTNKDYRAEGLSDNQILLCCEYDLKNIDAFAEKGQIEFKVTNLCLQEKEDPSETEASQMGIVLQDDYVCSLVLPLQTGDLTKMKEAVLQDDSNISAIEMTSMYIYIYGSPEYANYGEIKIVMKDGTVNEDIENGSGIYSDSERTKYTYSILAPIDLEQVDYLEIDGVRYEMQYKN